MANLSNINNKLVVTTDGAALINQGTVDYGTAKLQVSGNGSTGTITWRNDGGRKTGYLYSDSNGIAIYSTALNNAGIYLADNLRIDFRVNGSEKMRITSGGDVYIGNSAITTANTAIFLQKSGIITNVLANSGGTTDLMQFYQQNGGGIGTISRNADGICMNGNGQTNQLVVADSGNVGIGGGAISSPASVGTFLNITGRNSIGAGTAGIVLKDYDNAAWDIWNSGGILNFRYNNGASGAGDGLSIDTASNATFAGNIYSGLNGMMEFRSSGYNNRQIGIDSQGFYVFNPNAPSGGRYDLKINDTGNATFAGTVTTTDVYGASSLRVAALGGILYLDSGSSSSIILRTNGTTERMRITSEGTTAIFKDAVETNFDALAFLRLHPNVTTTNSFTNIFAGVSTSNNYGVSFGGLRTSGGSAPAFSVRTHVDSIIGAEKFRVSHDGDVVISGGGRILSSAGIYLGTNNNSNLLDDYEEGTFTMTMTNDGVGNTVTSRYTKVGRLVFIEAYFSARTISNAGNCRVSGLPFSADASEGYGILTYWHGTAISQNGTVFYVQGTIADGVAPGTTAYAQWVTGTNKAIMLAGFYTTA